MNKTNTMTKTELTGSWQAIEAVFAGAPFPKPVVDSLLLKIDEDRYEVQNDKGTLRLFSDDRMEITGVSGPNQDRTFRAIFRTNASELVICYDLSGKEWPATFETRPATQLFLVRYSRKS
jgi:uncharacterized protein (TIGR03067 family)